MHDAPSNSTIVGAPGKIVKKDGKKVDLPLDKTITTVKQE
jgi:serine acetyltransferase